LRRVCQGVLHQEHKVFPAESSRSAPDPAHAAHVMKELRTRMLREAHDAREAVWRIIQLGASSSSALTPALLASMPPAVDMTEAPLADRLSHEGLSPDQQRMLADAHGRVRAFDAMIRRRMEYAHSLLSDPGLARKIRNRTALARHGDAAFNALVFLRRCEASNAELRILACAFKDLCDVSSCVVDKAMKSRRHVAFSLRMRDTILDLRSMMTDAPRLVRKCGYGIVPPSIGGPAPPLETVGNIVQEGADLVDQLNDAYGDAMGTLAFLTEHVEYALGLEPLSIPDRNMLDVPVAVESTEFQY
jgi:hypothetical protein